MKSRGGNDGRDHHNRSFTMWLTGGGIKPGITHGETDDLGFNVTRDSVHVHDTERDAPPPPGLRPHASDLPLPGPGFPPDRCAW